MNFNSDKIFPANWQLKSISDVCLKVTSGGTPSRNKPEFYSNGIWPWVKTKELADGWVDTTEELITEEAIAKSSAKVLPAETVLMAMYGATVGQLGILREPMTCNQACCAMVVDEQQADFRYLYYLLLLHREQIRSIASGAAQQNLSGQQIKQLIFAFPPLEEQHRIANILGTLDDKIELSRRQNETLERVARALFQSWFVDFDPVRAKANGEAEATICQRLGLSPQVLALFPRALQKSALDEMPAGWEAKSICDLAEANTWTLGKNDTLPALDYIEISEVFNGNVGNTTTYKRGDEPGRARRRLRHGDTVLSTVRPDRGAYFLAINPSERLIASTGFAVFSPTAAPWSFVYTALTMPDVFEFLGKRADGAAYPVVHPNVIGTWPVKYPNSPELIMVFHDAVAPLLLRAEFNRQESRALATVRNELLPVLLSGELTAN